MLVSLSIWPSIEQIKQYFARSFLKDEFENIRCIIGCTEIECQTPQGSQDLEEQSELYSEYKSHNTFKGLHGRNFP